MDTDLDSSGRQWPLVSVLTVVRNGEKTIQKCIESVLAQTYPSVEHVIVDGVSTDGTLDILRSYGDKIGPWITEPDSGIYNALNKGIRLASGKLYIPLGCDDFLLPNAVTDLFSEFENTQIVMGKVLCRKPSGKILRIYNHSAGSMIPVSVHDQLGFYDESYSIAADTKFLQLARNAGLVSYTESVVGEFLLGGVSSNYLNSILEHARAMRESGSWSNIRSSLWIFPRRIFGMIKFKMSNQRTRRAR